MINDNKKESKNKSVNNINKKDNIFMHDAVPTWSGFLYQGRIAAYLAVKK